ncbi:unnamed protein product [Ambrosiozyma monospora]|uniref:Unnamed protein product n=1 Tax=Ambrosiozyma monospora TaxID=43982 RepID=A0ACB5T2H2_AMBMO|nr:unnamed protein product [Ambrosiozyma monospora]
MSTSTDIRDVMFNHALLNEVITQDSLKNKPTNNANSADNDARASGGLSCDSNIFTDESGKTTITVSIPEDDRFKLDLPSNFCVAELVFKWKKQQVCELEPGSLDSIHQTYINLIDLRDKTYVFTTSQLLQFLSIYLPFFRLQKSYMF